MGVDSDEDDSDGSLEVSDEEVPPDADEDGDNGPIFRRDSASSTELDEDGEDKDNIIQQRRVIIDVDIMCER